MQSFKRTLALLVPVLALSACTTLSDSDRALLTAASQNAEQAKMAAQHAVDLATQTQAVAAKAAQTADQAAQSASQAAKAAEQAAADAKAANEKADRMFQRSLHKVAPR